MNIYQRINEVRKAVAYVQKSANVNNRYKGVTHDAVTVSARDAMVKEGVVIVPSLRDSKVQDTGTTTKSGVPIIRYEALYDVQFINEDEPSEVICMVTEAHANDEGDKAPGKALSYAVKAALLKVLMLETGEDDESRVEAKRNLEKFGAEMREALEENDFIKVGRSLIEDQEIWQLANQGTQKNGGQFDSKHKKLQSDCAREYTKQLKVWAYEASEFADNDQIDGLMEIVQDIDNDTDKRIFWAALSAKAQNLITAQKAPA